MNQDDDTAGLYSGDGPILGRLLQAVERRIIEADSPSEVRQAGVDLRSKTPREAVNYRIPWGHLPVEKGTAGRE